MIGSFDPTTLSSGEWHHLTSPSYAYSVINSMPFYLNMGDRVSVTWHQHHMT